MFKVRQYFSQKSEDTKRNRWVNSSNNSAGETHTKNLNSLSSKLQLAAFFILPFVFFILHYQFLRGFKKIKEYSFFYWVSQSMFTLISIVVLVQFILQNQNPSIPIYAYLGSLCVVSILAYFSYQLNFKDQANNLEKGIQDIGYFVNGSDVPISNKKLILVLTR